jgi:hypothetical protein
MMAEISDVRRRFGKLQALASSIVFQRRSGTLATDQGVKTMVQERLSILTMLEEGKISVEEATALLDVMEQPDKPDPRPLEETLAMASETISPAHSKPPASEEAPVFNFDLEKLTEMKIHGVTPKFIQEMRELKLADLSTDKLLEMRIHGVTPAYVQEMRSFGLNPSAGELVEMRVHGVTHDYIRRMETLGLDELTPERLIEMRVHGVTPEIFQEFQELGLAVLDSGKLIEMRIHGVTPDYVREMALLGLDDLTPDRLIEMRVHGVDAGYVRTMKKLV